jgi:peptidoglycan/LPS O-acetylase OafA/YrhL
LDRPRLPALDGIRFLAALAVILYHCDAALKWIDGVACFLVLSGLLFCWLFSKEWNLTQTISLKKFYFRRTLRIIPAFYAAILVTIVLKLILGLPVNWAHAASMAGFVGNYYNAFQGHLASGFDLFWSISLEEQFYLTWPICFLYFMKLGKKPLTWFLVFLIVASATYRSIQYLFYSASSSYLYNSFETRLDSLGMGCLFGMLASAPRFRTLLAGVTRYRFTPILVLAGIICESYLGATLHYTLGLTIQSALIALLLLQLIILSGSNDWMWSWLNHPILVYLGTLSYSVYLYHLWGISLGHKLSSIFGLGSPGTILFSVIMSLGLGWISYTLVEQPFLRLKSALR